MARSGREGQGDAAGVRSGRCPSERHRRLLPTPDLPAWHAGALAPGLLGAVHGDFYA